MLRYLTAGESHGPALTAVVEGFPSGLRVDIEGINRELFRRQQGFGSGGRMRIERDQVEVLGGIRAGYTLGSPVSMVIRNRDFENWSDVMGVEEGESTRVVDRPRPGHADLPGGIKYGFSDLRNTLERASARETAVRVAVGALAKELLAELDIFVVGAVSNIGGFKASREEINDWLPEEIRSQPAGGRYFHDHYPRELFFVKRGRVLQEKIEGSLVRCPNPVLSDKMVAGIARAKAAGDTLGGEIVVWALGLPPGVGSHVHWDRRLDGRLGQALLSIPSVKAIEIGEGFASSSRLGSDVHDEIGYKDGVVKRNTNRAGGIEGGLSNGEPLVIYLGLKPIPSLLKPLGSFNIHTGKEEEAMVERSDVCAAPRAVVVAEAMVAMVLADSLLEMFANDTMADLKVSYEKYLERVRGYPLSEL